MFGKLFYRAFDEINKSRIKLHQISHFQGKFAAEVDVITNGLPAIQKSTQHLVCFVGNDLRSI